MNKNSKADIAANRKSTALWAGLSFVLPGVIMLAVLAANGITPFGNSTLITEGGLPWFDSFCRMYESIIEEDSIFYHFNTGFGSSFYSDFASGLCTPFMFAALFFPAERLAAAYSVITVLRAAFSGLFAWFALNKISEMSKHFSFAMACGYALCGFTACAAYYPSTADGVVFFPLLVMGIYSYVNESRPLQLFIFGAIFFITCSGLFVSGIIIAFVFYAAFYFRRGSKRQKIYRFAMFAAVLLCAAASTALLLIPMGAVSAYYENGIFSSVDTVNPAAALCFGGYGTSGESGTYYLCLAGLLIMGIFAFMFNSKIKVGERVAVSAGAAVILLSAVISPLGSVMFGFCGSQTENVNIGFMLAMISVYCTSRNFAESAGIKPWRAGVCTAAFVMLSAVSFALCGSDVFAVIAEAGLAAVFAALFVKLSYDRCAPSVKISVVVAAVLLLFGTIHCDAAVGGINSEYLAEDLTSDSVRRIEVNEEISDLENSANRSMGFFRYRSTDDSAVNGVNLNRNEIAGFVEFADSLGIKSKATAGGGENFTPLTDILFGVGYEVENDRVVRLDGLVQSPAYTALNSADHISEGSNAFELQNDIAFTWFGVRDIFTPAEYTYDGTTDSAESERYKWTFGNETTSVAKYTVQLKSDEKLYMLADGGDYWFAVNDDSRRAWEKGCAGGIYTLDSADGERAAQVYISADTGMGVPKPIFMVMSDSKKDKLVQRASQCGGTYISRRGNVIRFMLNVSEPQLAVTSIPYEYGWEIILNGEKVEPAQVCGGLIGINLESGSNSVVMEYHPPFFRISMILSVVMFILGIYITVYTEHEISRRRKVRMAFKAVELNLNRQSEEAMQRVRGRLSESDLKNTVNENPQQASEEDINLLSDNEDGFYNGL